ncbi:uncharacterized protein GLRG_04946 [Colletotrichum graminicola M1.001]|uniref:GPI transamidase component PIG-S n=1 Tax=Colletotrichum graminicola (strain M1.001 / M2 / FGSC 10212) TaxID=645133 RepID=E3QFW7_COLGM|nr:uncharacterized protein GLRG_04946 [Colletotrichum graminicola M1.001]EFQ29802.1 hypothetical protein GLRG_04946 [Colletotrichum graminicola M1.001]
MADYFCCPSDTTCLVLAENTTALCCPKGASCDVISPIICDITAQNVIENPTSPIHTTKLKESLPSCGNTEVSHQHASLAHNEHKDHDVGNANGNPGNDVDTFRERSRGIETISQPGPGAFNTPGHGGIIAGTTVAAVASAALLTCLLWLKRRSISEKVGSVRWFPRPWQQLRERGSEQDVSLPRYNSPPPAYTIEMKPPFKHTAFRHYSPDSVGDIVPVELPATPVSFSVWYVREEGEVRRPRTHYEPYRRPSGE